MTMIQYYQCIKYKLKKEDFMILSNYGIIDLLYKGSGYVDEKCDCRTQR